MSTGVHVDVLYHPDDADQVEPLLAKLAENGVQAHPADQQVSPNRVLAVLITPAMLPSPAADHAVNLAGSYAEVIPVSFLPGAAPIFAELSQSLISQLGADECARRVATIARHGGRAIVEWNNLAGRAQKWESEGTGSLLPEAEIPAALALLQSGPALESDRRPLVVDYIESSQRAVRRRRRTGITLVSVTAAVLTTVLVFAVVQAISARSAQLQAEREGGIADSNRLARIAVDMAAGDPDLPMLLADRALSAARTPAAEEAAALAMANSWPHTSYRLDTRPSTITAAANSPRIAVFDSENDAVVVYESAGGSVVGSFPVTVGPGYAAWGLLNPSGTSAAIRAARPNSLTLVDLKSGKELATDWKQASDVATGWLDDDTLLVGRDNTLLAINPYSGNTSTVVKLPTQDPITFASLSRNREHLVVQTDENVTAVDLTNGNASKTIHEAVRSTAITDDGKFILGTQNPYTVRIDVDAEEHEDRVTRIAGSTDTVLPLDSTYSILSGRSGDIHLIGDETILQSIRAHLSDQVRISWLNDGRLATVGADSYLRVWTPPDAEMIGSPTSAGLMLRDSANSRLFGITVSTHESGRNQIRMAGDDHVAVTLIPGTARVLSTEDLSSGNRFFFAGLDTDVALSRRNATIAAIGESKVQTLTMDESSHFWGGPGVRIIRGEHLTMGSRFGDGIGAVSEDGQTVVFADGFTLQTRTSDLGRKADSEFPDSRKPIALYADGSGAGAALTSDGYLRRTDETESPLPWDVDETVAAAEFTGPDELTLVTSDGVLFSLRDDTMTEIGSVGTNLDFFALRRSPSEKLIAVIGTRGWAVYDTDSGKIVHSEPSIGSILVTDIAFSSDEHTMFAVTKIGTVRKMEVGARRDNGQTGPPRRFTSEELALFQMDGN